MLVAAGNVRRAKRRAAAEVAIMVLESVRLMIWNNGGRRLVDLIRSTSKVVTVFSDGAVGESSFSDACQTIASRVRQINIEIPFSHVEVSFKCFGSASDTMCQCVSVSV